MPGNKSHMRRLVEIGRRIDKGDAPNCSQLAVDLEVNARTIRRDIEYMRDEMGAPIEYDASVRGYIYTEPNFRIPMIDVDETDLFAICMARKALRRYEGTPVYDKMARMFKRIRALVPDTDAHDMDWLEERCAFVDPPVREIDPAIWMIVLGAMKAEQCLAITYQAGTEGSLTERIFDAYQLVHYRHDWYLKGYCHVREAIRTLAVSRIQKAKPLAQKFSVPTSYDCREEAGINLSMFSGASTRQVRIWFSAKVAEVIAARKWQEGQRLQRKRDGSIVLALQTKYLPELISWILTWGGEAKVLSPKALATMVHRDLVKATSLYQ